MSTDPRLTPTGWYLLLLFVLVWTPVVWADAPEPEVLLRSQAGEEPIRRPDFAQDGAMAERRTRMVQTQIALRGVTEQKVLDAMARVPRHQFVPKRQQAQAYRDAPLPIGHGQTISQPYIVALMTEKLQLEPDDRVLELGTGSGYQAAIVAELVREVVTIEIIEPLARNATRLFRQLGYRNITTLWGDGYFGWEKASPYDAIIVTAAASHIPPPLIEQLKPGGRMVIPVGASVWTQNLLLVEKDKEGEITTRNLIPVRFVPLTGDR